MRKTLIRQPVVKHYKLNDAAVRVTCERGHGEDEPDPLTLKCERAALPFIAAQCVLLMARFDIRSIVVNGTTITFTHSTTESAE